jgi:Glycine cleavage T-protein C-terminal barrel domain
VLEHGIGLGLLDGDFAASTDVSVQLRGRDVAAQVVDLPFVTKATAR